MQKISRAFSANIGKLILLAKLAIENIFYVEKKLSKKSKICVAKKF